MEFPSIAAYGIERAANVLTRAFAGYFVSITFDVRTLLNAIRVDSVDLNSSCIFVRDGIAVGGALIARRGWTSRLAGMAIVPEARRSGVGRAAMDHLLAEAKARENRVMVLEVIEQNIAAVELYRACGFRQLRRLIGFAGPAPKSNESVPTDLTEVDLREVGNAVTFHGLPDLPWQLSGETVAQLTPPFAAYRLDRAWIALSNPAETSVTVRALIAERGTQNPTALLRAVMAKHPNVQEWRFSAVWPEDLADVVTPAGLTRTELTQFQMQRTL